MLIFGVVDYQRLLYQHCLHKHVLIWELVLVFCQWFESGKSVLLLIEENFYCFFLGKTDGLWEVGHFHALHQYSLSARITHIVHVRLDQLFLSHSKSAYKRRSEKLGGYGLFL